MCPILTFNLLYFKLISFSSVANVHAVVLDAMQHLILLRTHAYNTPSHLDLWNRWNVTAIMVAVVRFVRAFKLASRGQSMEKNMDKHARGTHFFSLFGYHRNNLQVSADIWA